MNTATDYDRRAMFHRPTDRDVLAAEIRRLHSTGLTRRDIASALRIDLTTVLHALTVATSHTGDDQ
jgi:hypothetical protein